MTLTLVTVARWFLFLIQYLASFLVSNHEVRIREHFFLIDWTKFEYFNSEDY